MRTKCKPQRTRFPIVSFFVLIIMLVMCTSGCADKNQISSAQQETALQYEKVDLPDELRNPQYAEIIEDTMYFLAENDREQYLVQYSLSESKFQTTKLKDYDTDDSIVRLAVNGSYYCYETIAYAYDEIGNQTMEVSLACYDFSGKEVFSFSAEDEALSFLGDVDYIESICFTDDNTLLLSATQTLVQMDLSGALINTLDIAQYGYTILKSGDGGFYLVDPSNNNVLSFDLSSFSAGDTKVDGQEYQIICKGDASADFVGIGTQSADAIGEETETIDLPDKGMTGIQNILLAGNGDIYILRNNLESYYNELYRVVTGTYVEPKTLTIAVADEEAVEPNLRYLVDQYNFDHDDFKIEISVYTEKELSRAFASQERPDLMLFGTEYQWYGMTPYLCAKKGLLVDMNTYLEKESVLCAEDLVPNVYENMQINGGLYTATYGFRVRTIYAREEWGAKENWTLAEFVEAAEQLPDNVMVTDATQSQFLSDILTWSMDTFVDFENASCDFENQLFYDVLELCRDAFPEEYDDNVFQSADEFLLNYTFSMGDFSMLCGEIEQLDDSAVFTGIPNANGAQFIYAPTLGITSVSDYPEAAWEFVCDYISQRNISAYISVLENRYESSLNDMNQSFSAETVTAVDAMVSEATTVTDHDTPVPEIVAEEAQAYFSGDKSAEETAKLIQQRVTVYLNEQK